VRDHGPGLNPSDLQRIFGRFERASSANYGGLGLGLYIALQLAEAHGGTVVASNPEDGGARFELRLPLP
jgi:signal transduction histidine kinase